VTPSCQCCHTSSSCEALNLHFKPFRQGRVITDHSQQRITRRPRRPFESRLHIRILVRRTIREIISYPNHKKLSNTCFSSDSVNTAPNQIMYSPTLLPGVHFMRVDMLAPSHKSAARHERSAAFRFLKDCDNTANQKSACGT
jgi:hypothetical protein